MKLGKVLLPVIILAVAVVSMTAFAIIHTCIFDSLSGSVSRTASEKLC